MADKRISKTYRLPPRTLKQMDWLADRMETTATDVIEAAVAGLFERRRREMRARLVPGDDGWYHLLVDNVMVLSVAESSLAKLGEHRDALFSPEGGEENLFGVVVLAAAAANEQIVIYRENIERIYAPLVGAGNQKDDEIGAQAAPLLLEQEVSVLGAS